MPYNNGWVTFTSMGIMASSPEYGQTLDPDLQRVAVGAVIYQHNEVSADDIPLGPACIQHVDDRVVYWLSTKGLREFSPSQGGGFGGIKIFSQAMSSFYSEYLLKETTLAEQDRYALHYARDCGWLFVSSKSDDTLPWYDRAHVYQFAQDRWGSFNHAHLHAGFGRPNAIIEQNHPFYGFINPAGQMCRVDHRPRVGSWVRFSPMRLQLPNEPIPASTVSSVQEVRLGTSRPPWTPAPNFGLSSSWLTDKRAAQHATKCEILLSGGWDSETQNVDEAATLMITSRGQNTLIAVGHVTGITHSLTLNTELPDEYFDVSTVEFSFFFAGQK
jgi:hypothetical protein